MVSSTPVSRITRINNLAEQDVSDDISLFGATIIPLLVLVWQIKHQVVKIKSRILLNQARVSADASSDWLQNCFNKPKDIVIPTTSISEEYVNKKRKANS